MRKLFLSLLTLICLCTSAQIYVWQHGQATPLLDVDSITFANKNIDEPIEPVIGLFSIAEDKQVQFSSGNLQYTQSTDTWSFASEQYEIIGEANVMGEVLADKIDLFGWSGSTGVAQWGVSISSDAMDFSGDFMDWGKKIDDDKEWFTMSYEEWIYLLNLRENALERMGIACIYLNKDGSQCVNGLILLPDNWTTPSDVTFKSGFSEEYYEENSFATFQTFTLSQWRILENAGAVFLPTSGGRDGIVMNDVNSFGYYWSSTPSETEGAAFIYFGSGESYPFMLPRNNALSVRLVQNASDSEEPVDPTEPKQISFSVSADKQVQFSSGNLQYTQSTDIWSFASEQYEIIGLDNVENKALSDKIDLFGWSGSTGVAQWGVSFSIDDVDYAGEFKDWGQNIGEKNWRTLSYDEWAYLMDERPNAAYKKGIACIHLDEDGTEYVNGLIILPDEYVEIQEIVFKPGFSTDYSKEAYATHQTFTLEQWQKLENAGAIFLPAAGRRYVTVDGVQESGSYWSSMPFDEGEANYFGFYSDDVRLSGNYRAYGFSVRLVKDL